LEARTVQNPSLRRKRIGVTEQYGDVLWKFSNDLKAETILAAYPLAGAGHTM